MPDGGLYIIRGNLGVVGLPTPTGEARLNRAASAGLRWLCAVSCSLLAWPLLLFAAVDGKFCEAKPQFHRKPKRAQASTTSPGESGGGWGRGVEVGEEKEDDAMTKTDLDRMHQWQSRKLISNPSGLWNAGGVDAQGLEVCLSLYARVCVLAF